MWPPKDFHSGYFRYLLGINYQVINCRICLKYIYCLYTWCIQSGKTLVHFFSFPLTPPWEIYLKILDPTWGSSCCYLNFPWPWSSSLPQPYLDVLWVIIHGSNPHSYPIVVPKVSMQVYLKFKGNKMCKKRGSIHSINSRVLLEFYHSWRTHKIESNGSRS